MQALAAIFLCLGALAGCASPQRFEFTRIEMGVQCRIVIYGEDRASTENAAAAAFAEVARLDAIMSDYRAESEVSRLSDSAGGDGYVPVSEDLFSILATSKSVSYASDGAFDVTIGKAVKHWREIRRRGVLEMRKIDAFLYEVDVAGWRTVILDPLSRSARIGMPETRLDLGGIAKGYAAQRAANLLRREGFPRCMVALSGDIVVGDAPPGQRGWLITTPGGERLTLANCGVSTSGDERQFVEIRGVRYSHIIDPRTGLGAIAPRPSCTVVAPRGEWADALSTAGYLVGREGWGRLESEFPGSRVIWGDAPK